MDYNKLRVDNNGADYWARLGAIMKENLELGISNDIYTDLVRDAPQKNYFRALLTPGTRYFDLTGKTEEPKTA